MISNMKILQKVSCIYDQSKRITFPKFLQKQAVYRKRCNLRYRVEKIEDPSDATQTLLQATVWPGPYAFAKTPDEKKAHHTAAFSEEGLQELVDWINTQSF